MDACFNIWIINRFLHHDLSCRIIKRSHDHVNINFSCLPQIIALSLIFSPSLDIFHDVKECFLKVKYPLQRNISLNLPQRIALAGKKKKKKDALEKLKIQQFKSIFFYWCFKQDFSMSQITEFQHSNFYFNIILKLYLNILYFVPFFFCIYFK